MTTFLAIVLTAIAQSPGSTPPAATGVPLITPEGPLQRTDMVKHRFKMKVSINYEPQQSTKAKWVLPLIADGPWSTLDPENFTVVLSAGTDHITLDGRDDFTVPTALGAGELQIAVPPVNTWPLHITVEANVTTWSSRLDNEAAMQIGWPDSWPAHVSKLARPSPLIESGAKIITDTVEQLTGGQVRSVPPIQAAKLIVQDACSKFEVGQTHMSFGPQGQLRGIAVVGAEAAAKAGSGSSADLVCICVAMLRAAGLPARPVIGIGTGTAGRIGEFGVWAEVYIPKCGWTPFDPDKLREQSIRTLNATQPWEYFGTFPQLQRRIPLSWSFAPQNGSTAFDSWAVWGWTRFLPSADFPVTITDTIIQTKSGPFSLAPQRTVPSSVRLDRK
ncbi:MAG: transglutaminase domain-containing protein [Phycisphaerae bacterium]|nr:transglutaminase domain-containing protein [Phycisphaerae bacterium]